ncbi:diacylglycerol kinase family lipid kinase [Chelativorans sp.]|uniref:diacylglycerol/lipid kinase family protein n=1 Tax=Chelativorans sp. TaxID=2203393 RepID=UPI002810C185|nr:diacylglycerol kinase family lipid kinase [Chelativorans sp.]
MRFRAVLNRDGGTLSTMDLDALSTQISDALTAAGHSVEVLVVDGSGIVAALRETCSHPEADVVLVGGGDGTVSLAAELLAGSSKVLAILPAGTMNLFARSLNIPLDPPAAVAALAVGRVRRVDMGCVNDKPFVHQFSIGMHPQLIRLRSRIPFHGRLGKLLASVRAAISTLRNPHNLKVAITIGEKELVTVTSGIGITNNLFGEGHLPYADRPDGGTLGVYITRAESRLDLLFFFLNMALGRWRRNEQVEIYQAKEVRLKIFSAERHFRSAMDGELYPLERDIHVRLWPKSLQVLVPAE